ncbi:MAG TPA: hypothetical protein GXZ52_05810 [Clostridiales bacterium]|nr:hypothetical protein [Clostridiales bacterium]
MGFIPKITCRKCKHKFSAIYSRCPRCGTKRVKYSTRTPVSSAGVTPGTPARERVNNNTKWQLIFGIILLAAVIIAVIVLITVSLKGGGEPAPSPPVIVEPTPTPTPTPAPTPTPTPTPTVTGITISYYTSVLDQGFAMSVGDPDIPLTATVYPLDVEATVTWSSSDESVVTVDQTGLVHAVASGKAVIYAECGGVTAKCDVWVR